MRKGLMAIGAVLLGACAPHLLNAAVAVRTYQGQNVRETTPAMEQTAAPEGASLVGVALVPALEFPSETYAVRGFRMNFLVGDHHDVYGLDIGVLGNLSARRFGGIGLAGLFNSCGQSVGGVHLAGLFNKAYVGFGGLQFAAAVNWTEGVVAGGQVALVNMAGRLTGVQLGAVNVSEKGGGLQFGLFNFSEELVGCQVGLVNLNMDSSVPMLPLLNFAF